MGTYLLPLTINNRRLYSLPLHTDSHRTGIEDFVIELKPHSPKLPLISIDKNKLLQTLHLGKCDILLSSLKPCVEVIGEKIHLILENAVLQKQTLNMDDDTMTDTRFKTAKPAASGTKVMINDIQLSHLEGLEIGFDENDKSYDLFLRNPFSEREDLENNKLEFEISFRNEAATYKSVLTLYIASQSAFFQFGFDFGSEASQIRQRRYVRRGPRFSDEIEDPSLFNIVRDYKDDSNDRSDAFFQYEEDTGFLKSIFFAKKVLASQLAVNDYLLEDPEGLLILKKKQEADRIFYQEWTQLPNLKIAHKYGDELGEFEFIVISNKAETKTLHDLKEKLYASILHEILESYLQRSVSSSKKCDLRITMLIPNIYDTEDICNSKSIVRQIVDDINAKKLNNAVRGCEIITLSESDAAFMGYYNSAVTKFAERNSYYIIIDCGKGTTDFSVVLTDDEIYEYKNIYRNGFAGAGNCITYAFFESFFYYIVSITSKKEKAIDFLRKFFQEVVGGQKELLFAILEKYKLNYNPLKSQREIEAEFKSLSSGDISFENLFEDDNANPERILELMSKCSTCFDWNGYISSTVNEITELIKANLSPIIKSLNNKQINCGGILLTGRGILFPLLYKQVRNAFETLDIQTDKIHHPHNSKDYKTVCLQGVFKDSYVYNPDIMCMPIEFEQEKEEINQTPKKKTFSERMSGMLKFFLESDIAYNQEINSLKVSQNEIARLRFIIGNYFYEPSNYRLHNSRKMELIFDGHRFILRSFDRENTLQDYCELKKDSRLNTDDNHHVIASLFPSIIHTNKIDFLKQKFPPNDPFASLMPMPRI